MCGGGGSLSFRSHYKHAIEMEAQTSPWSFWLLMSLNQKAKKGITVLGGGIDTKYHEEIGLPLCNEGRKDYVWSAENPLGHLLVLHVL